MKFTLAFTVLCIVCINALHIDTAVAEDNQILNLDNDVFEDDNQNINLENDVFEDDNQILNLDNAVEENAVISNSLIEVYGNIIVYLLFTLLL